MLLQFIYMFLGAISAAGLHPVFFIGVGIIILSLLDKYYITPALKQGRDPGKEMEEIVSSFLGVNRKRR